MWQLNYMSELFALSSEMGSTINGKNLSSEMGSTINGKNLLPWEQILSFYSRSPFFKWINVQESK